jgi:gluconate 5-dehydrogenase
LLKYFDLVGRVALVVGGGGGLGRAAALALAEAGADVAAADLNAESAQVTANAVRELGRNAVALPVDVTDPDSVAVMVAETEQQLGSVDILINAAGTTRRAPAEDMPLRTWQRILDVNLTGTFLCCQLVARHMIAAGRGGRIINFASIAGLVGLRDNVAYNASKGGVVTMTRGMALDWARFGIRVNAIAPSWFEAPMSAGIYDPAALYDPASRRIPSKEELVQTTVGQVPVGRMGLPNELVGAVIFLASPAAEMITGHVLAVDGGYTAQ